MLRFCLNCVSVNPDCLSALCVSVSRETVRMWNCPSVTLHRRVKSLRGPRKALCTSHPTG